MRFYVQVRYEGILSSSGGNSINSNALPILAFPVGLY